MTQKKHKSAFAGYVPAISRTSFDMLLEYGNAADDIYLINGSELPIRALRKDFRALDPNYIVKLFKPIIPSILEISLKDMRDTLKDYQILYMPDDEVTEYILENKFLDKNSIIDLDKRFYRWHQKNIDQPEYDNYDSIIKISEISSNILRTLDLQREKSNDWWRNVSAILSDNNDNIIISKNNRYVPNFYSAEISGDMRSNFTKGINVDYANAIHAEADLIASAACDGVRTKGLYVHVSTFPCPTCAKLLSATNISTLYFYEGYSIGDGYNILKSADINIIKVTNG